MENIVGKGENAGYQHFLLFPQCLQKVLFSGSLKIGIVWYRVKMQHYANAECKATIYYKLHLPTISALFIIHKVCL